MVRLNVEDLEGRALMSAVAPMPPAPGQATIAFTPPLGTNRGDLVSDGKWEGNLYGATSRPTAPANGIIAILIGL